MLRSADLLFLRALIPVMLEDAVTVEKMPSAVADTLQTLDNGLAHLSPEMLKLTRQLFDVLGITVTRGPLTGIWGSWENASSEDIREFLDRWENSSLSLLRMGHSSLQQMVMMAWYSRAESWAHCGYPGPPDGLRPSRPPSRASPLPQVLSRSQKGGPPQKPVGASLLAKTSAASPPNPKQ